MRCMLVALDTRDLITLERDEGELIARLEAGLHSTGGRLVLSLGVVNELAGASRRGMGDGLMRLLLRLEEMPHSWIREVDIPEREVAQALECFVGGDEYRAPWPYVESYLDTWDPAGDFRARNRSRSLAEILWDQLDAERRAGPIRLTWGGFPALIGLEREEIARLGERGYQAEVERAFIRKARRIASDLAGEGTVDLDGFARAAWERPEWCAGLRLQFEAQHAFERDTNTRPTASDMMDLARILDVPYVDVFSCDNSKRAYLSQLATGRSSRLRECGYWRRCAIARDVREVIGLLEERR